jgi:hypothetical protein
MRKQENEAIFSKTHFLHILIVKNHTIIILDRKIQQNLSVNIEKI